MKPPKQEFISKWWIIDEGPLPQETYVTKDELIRVMQPGVPRKKMRSLPVMRQIHLRESELGRRYGELGSFSKSADLKSLFTVNCAELDRGPTITLEGYLSYSSMVMDSPDVLRMWWRLSALACRPMQEAGADLLKAVEVSQRAAKAPSRSGKKSPSTKKRARLRATLTARLVRLKSSASRRLSEIFGLA